MVFAQMVGTKSEAGNRGKGEVDSDGEPIGPLPVYPNSFTALHAILMATSASALGAESLLAMVIRPNGCRPFLVESPGPP